MLQYEKEPDNQFVKADDLRAFSLACFSTHDTPTLRGFASGRDIDWWHKLGSIDDDEARDQHEARENDVQSLLNAAGQENDTLSVEVRDAAIFNYVHEEMANCPVAMISVQLDDVLAEIEAQNLPGTIDEHPNWRRRCRIKIDELTAEADFNQVCQFMGSAERSV